jgi:hypothetical protein
MRNICLITALVGSLLGPAEALVAPAPADASRGLSTGFIEGPFLSPDAATRQLWLGRAIQAGASVLRFGVSWGGIAPTRPADPANPADPAYRFAQLDALVGDAVARGFTPLLTVQGAPTWAEGGQRPPSATPGSWRPAPTEFGQFAAALARRYGGAFPDPAGSGVLPRVRLFQAWNEPNLDIYLSPQWQGKKPVGALQYRSLLNAFYSGVKSVHADNTVVSAGTAPFGDPPGGHRTRPVQFWRAVLCLRERKGKLSRTKCPRAGRAELDVLAHHPINLTTAPAKPAKNRDDASSADLGRVRRVLRAAERFRTLTPAGHRPLWATEIWWETNPLDTQFGVSPARQARFLEQALYLIWKAGGSLALNLQLADAATHAPGAVDQSGVFLAGGSPKPSLVAFRFPFVCDRLGRRTVRAWGKSPATGTVVIERARGARWQPIRSVQVGQGQVFTTRLRFRGKRRLRATLAGESSLVWTQR